MKQRDREFWERVQASADLYAQDPIVEPRADQPNRGDDREAVRRRRRRMIRLLDLAAVVFWTYSLLKLFVIDLDRRVLALVDDSFEDLADYRIFAYAGALLVLLVVLRWRLLLLAVYVAVFPLTVVFWKIPYLLFRTRNWLYAVAAVNIVIEVFRRFGLKVAGLCLGILAFGALWMADSRWLLAPAAVIALGLMLALYLRTLYLSLRPSEFLRVQQTAIEWVAKTKLVSEVSKTGLALRSKDVEHFNKVELDQFVNELSWSICINRGMYFWAYQLDRYRQSSAAVVTLLVQYAMLLGITIFTFTTVNFGLMSGWPNQFSYSGDQTPSVLRVGVYSMSTLALSSGAGIESVGDGASIVRLLAGLCGPVFLVGIMLSFVAAHRLDKESTRAREVVAGLKRQANEQQDTLRDSFGVTIEEAIVRLSRIGYAFEFIVAGLVAATPREFFEDPDASGSQADP